MTVDIQTRLLKQLVDEVEAIRAQLPIEATPPSSVEIKTSTRGVDVTVKAYVGSPVREAGDQAMDEFIRVTTEITARLLGAAA